MSDYVLRIEIFSEDTELGEQAGTKDYFYALPPIPDGFERSADKFTEDTNTLLQEMENFANSQSLFAIDGFGKPRSWSIYDSNTNHVIKQSA